MGEAWADDLKLY